MNRTIPKPYDIYTSCTSPDKDGVVYCIDFLAKDFDHAKLLCEKAGLAVDERNPGLLECIIVKTPDGPLTEWDRDGELDGHNDGWK